MPAGLDGRSENFQEAYPDAFEANVHMPPMGHYGDVEKEIGRVVVQLANFDFKFMSGETLTLKAAWASVRRRASVATSAAGSESNRASRAGLLLNKMMLAKEF